MNKKKYIKPELTVVSFKTEQGFASSGSITFTIEQNELYNEQCQEKWTDGGNLFGNGEGW